MSGSPRDGAAQRQRRRTLINIANVRRQRFFGYHCRNVRPDQKLISFEWSGEALGSASPQPFPFP
jgi:hypothetical protein